MLLDLDGVAEDCDVVIGGEEGNQAKDKPPDGLGEAKAVEAWPGRRRWKQVCRKPRLCVAGPWDGGWGTGWGHPSIGVADSPMPPIQRDVSRSCLDGGCRSNLARCRRCFSCGGRASGGQLEEEQVGESGGFRSPAGWLIRHLLHVVVPPSGLVKITDGKTGARQALAMPAGWGKR